MKRYTCMLLFVLMGTFLWASAALVERAWANGEVDHSLYAELLTKYVINGVVDYAGFKSEETKLDQYLKILEMTDSKMLSHNERFAFYINAYNAWTIKLILSAYPGLKSIKDLGSLFKTPWEKFKAWIKLTALPWLANGWYQIVNMFVLFVAYKGFDEVTQPGYSFVIGAWIFVLLVYYIFWKLFGFEKVWKKKRDARNIT